MKRFIIYHYAFVKKKNHFIYLFDIFCGVTPSRSMFRLELRYKDHVSRTAGVSVNPGGRWPLESYGFVQYLA